MKIVVKPITGSQLKEHESTNHIIIFDRSGSMHYTLPGLIADLKEHKKVLKLGDTLSIAWFSTENGQYNYILKGHTVNSSTYEAIDKVLDRANSTIGLTCFSEVLAATEQVVQDLKVLSPHFNLIFMTDGYPVVSNHQREESKIFEAIKRLSPHFETVLLVGYGDWYNRELMQRMAKAFKTASLIHSSNLEDYDRQVKGYLQALAPTVEIEVGDEQVVFTISTQGLVSVLTPEAGKVRVPQSTSEVFIQADSGLAPTDEYAAYGGRAIIGLQDGDTGAALEALAATGDVAMLDKISNAFTNTEVGEAIQALQAAIADPKLRYANGRNDNYLPDPDAFCLLDLLELLQEDSKAKFYPYHPDFHYKRTGVPSKAVEGYPEFIKKDANPGVELSTLTWNESRANISIQCKVDGAVNLGDEAVAQKLSKHFYTHIFRNYTIVKDGTLNVTSLPVSTTEKTYKLLKARGLVNGKWQSDGVYHLDLTKLPIINRQIAAQYNKADVLVDNVREELRLRATLKVYNYFLKELQPEKSFKEAYTAEQEAFLRSKGIAAYGFNPPVTKAEVEDYYMGKEFDVTVKGCSSLPKVDDVMARMESGKPQTTAGELMVDAITDCQVHAATSTVDEHKEWLINNIDRFKQLQWAHKGYIQRTKFAVIVGKAWFKELSSREGGEYAGCKFALKEVKVAY